MLKLSFSLALCLSLLAVAALADQIVLKNGDRLTGSVVKSDGKTLVIKTEYAGAVTVHLDAIQEITSSESLTVTSKSGQKLIGLVSISADQAQVTTAETGKVTLARADIAVLRNKEEQAAYQAEIDRYANPGITDLWTGAVDLGLSLTKGNADTLTFTVGAEGIRATRRDKTRVYYASINARNSTNGPSRAIANARRGGVRYDLNVTPRSYIFAFTDLEFDEFQKLDLRLVLGGGAGVNVIKSEMTTFDLFGGGAYNKEIFTTLRRNSAEVFAGEEFTKKLSGRTSIRQRSVIYPNLSETGQYRLQFDAGIITALSRYLSWQVTLSDRYLSNPLPGVRKNDLLLTAGIRVALTGRK
jgi:putative salt-induced outer membrane protein YdiY